jgi:hypothetical protein
VLATMIVTTFIYTLAGFPSVGLGPAAPVAVFTVDRSAIGAGRCLPRSCDGVDGGDRLRAGAQIESTSPTASPSPRRGSSGTGCALALEPRSPSRHETT